MEPANLADFTDKSEMVYAVDSSGNKIAIGLFVTDSFALESNTDIKAEFDNTVKSNDNPNRNWVTAVEECVTVENDVCEDMEDNQPIQPIPVYKVKRARKLNRKGKMDKKENPKTLRELMKIPSTMKKSNATCMPKKNETEGNSKRKRGKIMKKRKIQDKCFPKPSCLQNVIFPCKFTSMQVNTLEYPPHIHTQR